MLLGGGTRSWEDGFFAQDDWRISQFRYNYRRTLSVGIRYHITTWPAEDIGTGVGAAGSAGNQAGGAIGVEEFGKIAVAAPQA